MSPRRELFLKMGARHRVSAPAKAIERPMPDILLGYTAAATAYAKACNNFWKISALVLFIGLAAFPDIADQTDASKATGAFFGTTLGRENYFCFGSLFLLLITIPFANAHSRYINIKSTIDMRLLADKAQAVPFVSVEEIKKLPGKDVSGNPLVGLMNLGSAFASLSETTYANFTATNHALARIPPVRLPRCVIRFLLPGLKIWRQIFRWISSTKIVCKVRESRLYIWLSNYGVGNLARDINWGAAMFWFTGLPLIGAAILSCKMASQSWLYWSAFVIIFLFTLRPLYAVTRLHLSSMRLRPAKTATKT